MSSSVTDLDKHRALYRKSNLAKRIEEGSFPITESGCWIWMGHIDRCGRGQIRIGKPVSAHRVAWMAYRGEIPDQFQVLHRCDIRCCVNPDHLFLGTHADNMRDCKNKGRRYAGSFSKAFHATNTNAPLTSWRRQATGAVLKDGRWEAGIVINRRRKYLGKFRTKEEATAAYRAALSEIEGERP